MDYTESSKPNYPYWCKQVPFWELHELCFLLSDFEPLHDSEDYAEFITNRHIEIGSNYFALRKCTQYEESLKPAEQRLLHVNANTKKTPRQWIEIADKYEFQIPTALRQAVEKYAVPPVKQPTVKAEKQFSQNARLSLVKLAYGMAKAKYGYDPDKARSDAVPRIKGDLERAGVPLDDETIRDYLREGAGHADVIEEA